MTVLPQVQGSRMTFLNVNDVLIRRCSKVNAALSVDEGKTSDFLGTIPCCHL